MMDALTLLSYSKHAFPHECIQWLVNMVSTEGSFAGTPQQTTKSSTTVTRLKRLRLHNLTLLPQDWKALIKAIDFSMLQWLFVTSTNFSQEQLDLLIECISATDATSVPLEILNLHGSDLLVNADKHALRATIRGVAPRVTIQHM